MVRGIMFFFVVWIVVAVSITAFRTMSGAEKWSLAKTASYGGVTAFIASIIIGAMVVIF